MCRRVATSKHLDEPTATITFLQPDCDMSLHHNHLGVISRLVTIHKCHGLEGHINSVSASAMPTVVDNTSTKETVLAHSTGTGACLKLGGRTFRFCLASQPRGITCPPSIRSKSKIGKSVELACVYSPSDAVHMLRNPLYTCGP